MATDESDDLPAVLSFLDPERGATTDEQAARCLEIANDPEIDPEHRGLAVTALGPGLQLGGEVLDWSDPFETEMSYFSQQTWESILDTLERLYRDADMPKEVRRRALEAAVRAPAEWAQGAVRAAWQTGDPDWMLTAVFAMGWVSGFDDEIAEALNNPVDERVFQEAISVAAEFERSEFAPLFEEIAAGKTDHDRVTRLVAIEALGTADVKRPQSWALLNELSGSRDSEIAEVAQWAIEEYLLLQQLQELEDELS